MHNTNTFSSDSKGLEDSIDLDKGDRGWRKSMPNQIPVYCVTDYVYKSITGIIWPANLWNMLFLSNHFLFALIIALEWGPIEI